jgi:hypothetical protein
MSKLTRSSVFQFLLVGTNFSYCKIEVLKPKIGVKQELFLRISVIFPRTSSNNKIYMEAHSKSLMLAKELPYWDNNVKGL